MVVDRNTHIIHAFEYSVDVADFEHNRYRSMSIIWSFTYACTPAQVRWGILAIAVIYLGLSVIIARMLVEEAPPFVAWLEEASYGARAYVIATCKL